MHFTEQFSPFVRSLFAIAALVTASSLSRASEAIGKTSALTKTTRCYSSDELVQMFTKFKRPDGKLVSGFVSKYETDGEVVELEPYIVLGDRDSISDYVRRYLDRPRTKSVELIRGVPTRLESADMMKLPMGIALASEPSLGTPRDAPGGAIPLGLILATPTISRDLAGWIEKNFVK